MPPLLSFFNSRRLVLYAAFFVLLRIVLELWSSGELANGFNYVDISAVILWLFWYAGTLLMAVSCFRYVAGMSARESLWVLLATPVLLIPVATAALYGKPLLLDFLSYQDPDTWAAIGSLMFLSAKNHFMFYELAVLAASIPVIAYLYSKSLVRALLTFVAFYAALIFLQGFIYLPEGAFKGSWLVYVAVTALLWLVVFIFPELRRYCLQRLRGK